MSRVVKVVPISKEMNQELQRIKNDIQLLRTRLQAKDTELAEHQSAIEREHWPATHISSRGKKKSNLEVNWVDGYLVYVESELDD